MRQIALFSLALIVVFAVAGCKKQETDPPEQVPVETKAEPNEPAKAPESAPEVSLEELHDFLALGLP